MQKTDLIKAVVTHTGLTQKDAASAVNAALTEIAAAVGRGEKVTLSGFGSFVVRERQEREGVNPQTRERITIAATKTVGFVPGAELRAVARGASPHREANTAPA